MHSSTFPEYTNAVMCQLFCGIWLLKAFPLHFLLQGVRDLFVDYLLLSQFFPSQSYTTYLLLSTGCDLFSFYFLLSCDNIFYFFKYYLEIPIFLTFQITKVMKKPFLLFSAILQLHESE